MYYDSKATLSKVYNVVYNGKTRYSGLQHNYVRKLVKSGNVKIVYVKTIRNLTGPLIKPLMRDLVGTTMRLISLKP